MYHNFEELLKDIKKKTIRKTIAVAAAHDREVLASASAARKEGIADFILIGEIAQIRTILVELGEVPDDWTIINQPDDFKAAQHAVLLGLYRQGGCPYEGLLHIFRLPKGNFPQGMRIGCPRLSC